MGVLALGFCGRLRVREEMGALCTRLRPGTVMKKTRKVGSFSNASYGIAKGVGTSEK